MRIKKIFGDKYIELTGSIHNHTKYSYDSQAEPYKIIQDAKKQALDYILISDHSNNEAMKDKVFMNEKDIFVIVGFELNDKKQEHHYLVFGETNLQLFDTAIEYTKYYFNKENTATFAAHPFDKRAVASMKKYIWEKTDITDFHGIEIWNAVSDWIEKLNPKRNGFFFVFFPSFFIKSADKEAIKWWDDLNKSGMKKSAIGSSDAHTFPVKKFGITFRFLTHNFLFKTVRTNILVPYKENIEKEDILKALKNGNSYIINYKRGYPDNFYAGITDGKDKKAIFGQEIDFTKGLKLYFHSPYLVKAKCFRNGEKIAEHTDNKGVFEIKEKGNYRLEIERNFKKWIYTNNIYVK